MTHDTPLGDSAKPAKAPIETKVKWATGASAATVAALLYILQYISDNPETLTALPDPIEPLVVAAVTALVTFGASYSARHTLRNDPAAYAP